MMQGGVGGHYAGKIRSKVVVVAWLSGDVRHYFACGGSNIFFKRIPKKLSWRKPRRLAKIVGRAKD